MASSEYTRAFLLNNCGFFRRYLFSIPCIANFLNARRINRFFFINVIILKQKILVY